MACRTLTGSRGRELGVKEPNQDASSMPICASRKPRRSVVRLTGRSIADSVAEFVRSETYHQVIFGRLRFTIGASIYTYRSSPLLGAIAGRGRSYCHAGIRRVAFGLRRRGFCKLPFQFSSICTAGPP